MFSHVWSSKKTTSSSSRLIKNFTGLSPVVWREHCVECAMPHCYSTCLLYEKRLDGRCKRFVYGFQRVMYADGNRYGAKMAFKRWAKLEAVFPKKITAFNPFYVNKLYIILIFFGEFLKTFSNFSGFYKIIQWYEGFLERFFKKINLLRGNIPNYFYIQVKNTSSSNVNLILDFYSKDKVIYKDNFILFNGVNDISIPFENFNFDSSGGHKLSIYLSGDQEVELEFQYLDFIRSSEDPVVKIKCIAWDLDNTMWSGIIGDDGSNNVLVKKSVIDLIKRFDELGFLQTILSKNTYEVAWDKVVELGIDDYFLYPAINWSSKSSNLRQIVNSLNIGMDSVAFIDDSEFEREEVCSSFPDVRCYDAINVDLLIGRCEFDIVQSHESRNRRISYKLEEKRNIEFTSHEGDKLSFLKSCGLVLKVYDDFTEVLKNRCFELLQRSNQYNLKTIRYSLREFEDFFNSEHLNFALEVNDRFGDYGIVAFARFSCENEVYFLEDFVMSCRVAQKGLEREFMSHFISGLQVGSLLKLTAKKTNKNEPLRDELRKMPFDLKINSDDSEYFEFKKRDEQQFISEGIFSNITI